MSPLRRLRVFAEFAPSCGFRVPGGVVVCGWEDHGDEFTPPYEDPEEFRRDAPTSSSAGRRSAGVGPRPGHLGAAAGAGAPLRGSTTGPRARIRADPPGDHDVLRNTRLAGISLPPLPAWARASYGGARLIIVRSVVRIHPELCH